jgi:hypothetical protein
MYTIVVNHGFSFGYKNHFWIKDVTFGVTMNNKMHTELTICEHKLQVDNIQMMAKLMELKTKQQNDDIDMSDDNLMNMEMRRRENDTRW